MPQPFEKTYSYNLTYNRHSSVGGHGDSLSEVMSKADTDRRYYSEEPCNYPGPFHLQVYELCKECQGEGQVPSKRKGRIYSFVKCKSCKGVDSDVTVVDCYVQKPRTDIHTDEQIAECLSRAPQLP